MFVTFMRTSGGVVNVKARGSRRGGKSEVNWREHFF